MVSHRLDLVVFAFSVLITVLAVVVRSAVDSENAKVPDLYTLKATDIDGDEIPFDQFRGRISLVVNIANGCSYADRHYKGLGRMLDIIGPDKFTVLAFPCNQFGGQEPGTSEEIKDHLFRHYGIEYPVFKKIDVIGGDAHPVFKNLAAQWNQAPDWNFWKYLVNENGRVMNAWGPKDRMEDIFLEVRAAVLRMDALAATAAAAAGTNESGSNEAVNKEEL